MKRDLTIDYVQGNCPVEAEGTIGGERFYFRSRNEHCSIGIGGEDLIFNPKWFKEMPWGDDPCEAGWMPQDEARRIVEVWANEFLDEKYGKRTTIE